MSVEAVVVTPTYNERANVQRLIPAVLSQSPGVHILVVDDASPDGTGALVEEMAGSDPRIHVLHREGKLGLGTAYVDGFRWVLEKTEAPHVIQMDADLSHDPAMIPTLLEELKTADLVVGSRYKTGVNVINWPLKRLLISITANRYAAAVTGLPVRDVTGGFNAYRRSVLEALPLDRIRTDGYGFLIELKFHTWKRDFRIREIPIIFTDRVEGESKLSQHIFWQAVWLVWKLRFGRHP